MQGDATSSQVKTDSHSTSSATCSVHTVAPPVGCLQCILSNLLQQQVTFMQMFYSTQRGGQEAKVESPVSPLQPDLASLSGSQTAVHTEDLTVRH